MCEKSTVKTLGWILSLGFLVTAAICIILAGVNFPFLYSSFKNAGWQGLAATELVSIIYAIILSGLGILTFCGDWRILTIIYSVLLGISTLFTGAIAIFAIVGGSSSGTLYKYFGCNSAFTGVLSSWNYIDSYLMEVDTSLCSTSCPCLFKQASQFNSNTTVFPSFDNWVSGGTNTAFQNCTATVQSTTLANYYRDQPNAAQNFNQETFANYWSYVEKAFDCSGWCTTSYTNANNQPMTMYKYMFTDINR